MTGQESKVERRRSLVDRLRGIYRIPIRDGLGPVATSEEPDNPNEYVRTFPGLPPIHGEAAEEIGRLRAVIRVNWLRLGASDAELDKALYGEDEPSPAPVVVTPWMNDDAMTLPARYRKFFGDKNMTHDRRAE